MSTLLRIYDNVTSNKYVSLGITVASTAFMAYRTVSVMRHTNSSNFMVSSCVGVVFALIAKYNLAHNDEVKSERERNSVYATASLIVAFVIPVLGDSIYQNVFLNPGNYSESLFFQHRTPFSYGCINGLGLGFLASNLVLQLVEGTTSIKFRSPIIFS